jgi:hypothetical protein
MRLPTQKGWARSTSLVWVLGTSLGRDMIAIDLDFPMVQRDVYSVGHRRRQPQADRATRFAQFKQIAIRAPCDSRPSPSRLSRRSRA